MIPWTEPEKKGLTTRRLKVRHEEELPENETRQKQQSRLTLQSPALPWKSKGLRKEHPELGKGWLSDFSTSIYVRSELSTGVLPGWREVNSPHFPTTSLERMAPKNVPSPALRLLIRGGSLRPPLPLSQEMPPRG